MTDRTPTTALDVAWEALWLALGNEDAGPAGIIARHRPLIEAAVWDLAEEACAEARAEGLDVERCRYCGKPFNGKPHSHGVRYLPRPKGPPPPPPPPTPGPLSVDPDMDQL